MKELLQLFLDNRETLRRTFRWENSSLYPVCANLFCARGLRAEEAALQRCRDLIRQGTGTFSSFRGHVRLPAVCLMAMDPQPEALLDRALERHRALRTQFMDSDYLALTALLLADEPDMAARAARGKSLYLRMRKEHPFLTGSEDSVFAVFLAGCGREEDALAADMEASYQILRERFRSGDSVQTISHMLALTDEAPKAKAVRVIDFYDELVRLGGKPGRYWELVPLAALTLMEDDLRTLAGRVMEVDGFLAGQKGYGFFGPGRSGRLMHAAMLVSDRYARHAGMEAGALASTMAIVIAQQIAACAAISASAASASSR